MAESIVSDIAVELMLKLGSFAFNEIGVCWGLNDELAKLKRTVATVEAVLLHAEEKSLHNPQVKTWLEMLSEALYDADDLLDEFSYEALHQQVMGGSEVVKKVRLFFSGSNPFAFGFKMGQKVKALRERLDEIAAEKIKFHLEERSVVSRSLVPNGRYQTHSSPPQIVIGREHDREEIVRLLLSSDCDENVSVVSVVGIGGLGKTTLAQMVYNDDRVQNHFELNIWVCVSNDFDVQLLVRKVIESITRKSPETIEMDPLKNSLHEKINGRRYLLVLDDVWNQDVHKWSSFKDLLDGGARGSRIMITTRFRRVAEMSRAICIHELQGLSANESWSLFEQVALKQRHLLKPSLEAIGKEIVGKCCGVPLAIKAIGGVLYFKNPDTEWLSFKDNELLKLDVFSHDILPILRLSYNHLPSHYKRCFAYCSLYPKGFPIHVNQIIYLWIAQGYIKSTNPNESLRDVGLEYFMDLFRSSFFQDVQMDYFGNIAYCYIHDLMHDLAVSAVVDDFSALDFGTTCAENNIKHLSFRSYQTSIFLDISSLLKAKKLRTLLQFNENVYFFGNKEVGLFPIEIEKIDTIFCSLRSLRVLSFSQLGIRMLPNSIVKLKHLRYLDLSQSSIEKLPNSITNLYNLRVLILNWCQNLKQLPKNITKLVNLTDLDNYFCVNLSHMPKGIGKLTRLEKLSEFVIADDHSVSKNIGGLDELHALNNLRGELRIKNLRYVKNVPSEFTRTRLSLKHKLQGLTLDWGDYDDETDNCRANDVANEETGMETLCPHPNLKKLWVWNYRGVKSPSWLPSLVNLVSLEFDDCEKIQWLPYLNTERSDVKNEGPSLFFPSLTDLTFEDCPNLKGFEGLSTLSTEELPCFPSLSQLEIGVCPNLTYLPLFPKLKKFYSEENGIESLVKIMKIRKKSASRSNSSPFSTLSELQLLCIWFTKKTLENEFLQYFGSLQSLIFENCSFKTVFSDEKDDEMQWKSLNVLRDVEFRNMDNLVALPKGLQFVTSLEHLLIHVCPSLECIPEWMPKLIALQHLTIFGSPQLEERCKNNSAEDWPNISHIPNIYIGYEQIQRNGHYLL